MTFDLTTPVNAMKSVGSQFGSVISTISNKALVLFKGWFTGDGPLARFWSGVQAAFDAVIAKFQTGVEEKPLVVAGIATAVALVAVLIGPALLGKFFASTAGAVGKGVAGVIRGFKTALSALWRS